MAQTKPCPESQAAVKLLTQGCLATPRSAVPGAPGAVGTPWEPLGRRVSGSLRNLQTRRVVVVRFGAWPDLVPHSLG